MKVILFIRKLFKKSEKGQATVELAIMFPVVLVVAVIAVNAIMYFSECSKFDRTVKQTISMLGTSPGYGENSQNVKANLQKSLDEVFDKEYLEVSTSLESVSGDFNKYSAELKMHPTLFGLGLKSQVFGVSLPTLNHKQELVIETYKPGVIF